MRPGIDEKLQQTTYISLSLQHNNDPDYPMTRTTPVLSVYNVAFRFLFASRADAAHSISLASLSRSLYTDNLPPGTKWE